MSKFTKEHWLPGYGFGLSGDVIPWQCFLDDEDCEQLPIRVNGKAVTVINDSKNAKTHIANANLIAAAPDLYEALENLLEYLETDNMVKLNMNLAKAALTKVDGKAR